VLSSSLSWESDATDLQVGGKLLNPRFKMVAGRLKDAFAILSGVVTITQGWQEPDLSAAVAADMHMVVAEVQTQGSEGQLQLKVGNWRGSMPLFFCGAPPASLPAGASNLPFLSPRTSQALLDQQTAEDRSWIQQNLHASLGALGQQLCSQLFGLGMGRLHHLTACTQQIGQDAQDIKRSLEDITSRLELLSKPSGPSSGCPAASSSSAGSSELGCPEDLGGMSEEQMLRAADKDGSGSITALELAGLLAGYGLRVDAALASQLLKAHCRLNEVQQVSG
jgi:hypothetical protein